MSAEHIYERSNKAAREVDPLVLASALDHIAKTAAKSRSQTRRIRWIELRATMALEGREYRDIDVDLPKSPGRSPERMSLEIGALKKTNAMLLEALEWREQFEPREGEDSNDRFERVAAAFYRDTGYLRPGKDCLMHSPEERQEAWDAWMEAGRARVRAAIAAARGAA